MSLLRRVLGWLRREPAVDIDVDAVMKAFEQRFEQRLFEEMNRPKTRAVKTTFQPAGASICPTPRKVKYPSLSAAKSHRSWKANKGARMRAYKCPCGSWHLARRES